MRQGVRRDEMRRAEIQDSRDALDLRKEAGALFFPETPESCDIERNSKEERAVSHWAGGCGTVP